MHEVHGSMSRTNSRDIEIKIGSKQTATFLIELKQDCIS
jgi:hypothetical protein